MRLHGIIRNSIHQAPRKLGAFFCALGLVTTGCDRNGKTPDWNAPQADSQPSSNPPPSTTPIISANAATPADGTGNGETGGLRFISYNVENWLTMDRYVNRQKVAGMPKPASEKEAIVRILARQAPDVIGICEVGTPADLEEIRERLKAGGLDLPNTHYSGGADPTRHLGLLSRFPITSTANPAVIEFRLAGHNLGVNRGILDATIQARGKSYRFLGVHLKSKRPSEQGDQELIRLNEARLLRRHVDTILKADPQSRLVVYGDFNDTRSTPTLRMIIGRIHTPDYLTPLSARDSNQETWTHYWELNDIYSRFDFILVSEALRPDTDFQAARIIDDAEWKDASDHRPVLANFR